MMQKQLKLVLNNAITVRKQIENFSEITKYNNALLLLRNIEDDMKILITKNVAISSVIKKLQNIEMNVSKVYKIMLITSFNSYDSELALSMGDLVKTVKYALQKHISYS